jgi:hypothetical protein
LLFVVGWWLVYPSVEACGDCAHKILLKNHKLLNGTIGSEAGSKSHKSSFTYRITSQTEFSQNSVTASGIIHSRRRRHVIRRHHGSPPVTAPWACRRCCCIFVALQLYNHHHHHHNLPITTERVAEKERIKNWTP